jgi:vancomycin resistance protein YoaR
MPETAKTFAMKRSRPLLIAGIIFIVLVAVVTSGGVAYAFAFRERVLPGVKANGLELGGLTPEEASAKLNAEATIFENQGLSFTDGKTVKTVSPVRLPGGNPDAARQIFRIDHEEGLSAALAVGKTGSAIQKAKDAISALFLGKHISVDYTLNEDGIAASLRETWKDEEKPVKEARYTISLSGNSLSSVTVIPSSEGYEFDYPRAITDLRAKIAVFGKDPVMMQIARTHPTVKTSDAEAAKPLIAQALALAPLSTGLPELEDPISVRDLASMLEAGVREDGRPTLRIGEKAGIAYVSKLAEKYDISPANTRYEIDPATKKMALFEAGKDGRKIDAASTIQALNAALAKQLAGEDGKAGFAVVAAKDSSQVVTDSAQELGIKEVIGVGQSDFSGSSSNRLKNILHGSEKLNGILIAPDQEFSSITALEPITLEDGYFAEQVILGNKLTPEVGGGLCQIGTTLFRMAMNTGLPITERQNHSLVVRYYADATNGNPGTDATLYGPHPDLRFVNDTGHWMLLTTVVDTKTKKLTYTLWGTSDGRRGSYTPPQVLKWIPAPAEVTNVEDPAMKPGEQKCQNAFAGAKTTFTYTITRADGTSTQRDFGSNYRALPKICTNGPAVPGTVLPDGTVVPAESGSPEPMMNNIVLPPEASAGN